MKLLKSSFLAITLLLVVTSCSKEDIEQPTEANYSIDLNLANETDWQMAGEVLVLVNEHRATLGLTPILKDQTYASAYAVEHTKYMIATSQVNHDNFEVRSGALKNQGAEVVGENVAYGYTNAHDVVQGWLNSPGHKKVIEGKFSHSGFGILKSAEGRFYFTQLFYRR